ncbi:MAG TPA: hypothetical protein VN493_21820 [Thermoanaerobaculia bacterium]|nr:hypothetical protein [Thermoanaerobaculia bacterium]
MVHALLCVALLLGALDLHPADAPHEPLSLGGEAVYFPGAAHPGEPVHVESATPVEQPHCAACLHRLETRGACLEPAVLVLPADLTFRLWLAPAPSAAPGSRRAAGARAPPLS